MLLGQSPYSASSFADYDSLKDVLPALNDGMRRVSIDIGVAAQQIVTVAANTFTYTLDTPFIQSQDGFKTAVPFNATRLSSTGKTLTGMKQTPLAEFGTVTGGGGGSGAPTSEAVGYSIVGRSLWIYPAGTVGDRIYVTGPREIVPFSSFTSLPTIYKSDRHAACWWAAKVLAQARGDYERATELQNRYIQHCIARTGKAPVLPSQ